MNSIEKEFELNFHKFIVSSDIIDLPNNLINHEKSDYEKIKDINLQEVNNIFNFAVSNLFPIISMIYNKDFETAKYIYNKKGDINNMYGEIMNLYFQTKKLFVELNEYMQKSNLLLNEENKYNNQLNNKISDKKEIEKLNNKIKNIRKSKLDLDKKINFNKVGILNCIYFIRIECVKILKDIYGDNDNISIDK